MDTFSHASQHAALPAGRRRQVRFLSSVILATAVLSVINLLPYHSETQDSGSAFSLTTGMNKKQMKSTLHTRGNLPDVLEVPQEVPEEEPAPKEPEPSRRVPYSMHIVSHFPQNKHLHEESNARKVIEQKITHAFENFEDIIKHVEINLQVSTHFHRDQPGVQKERVALAEDQAFETSAKKLAPYIFKVTVSLKNQRSVLLSNPEKHAQPTLRESIDHMVEVLKSSLRDEKERIIQSRKKAKSAIADASDQPVFEDSEAELLQEEAEIEEERYGKLAAQYED